MKIKFTYRFEILCLLCFLSSAWPSICSAQFSIGLPDSIILFSIIGNDTNTKSPYKKISFLYDPQTRMTEKRVYLYEIPTKSWLEQSIHSFQYIGNEVIELVKPVNYSNEALRTTYKFNKNRELVQYEIELQDPKTKNYSLYYRRVYLYEKDSVKKVSEYRQGTTFFLQKETKYLGKEVIERTYNEIEPKLQRHLSTKLYLNNKKQVLCKQFEQRNPTSLQYRIGNKLQNGLLMQDTLVYKTKSKKDSCDLIRTYSIEKGNLTQLMEYKSTKEGTSLQSSKGSLYMIFPSLRTKKTITRSDCLNKLEDILIFSHLPW